MGIAYLGTGYSLLIVGLLHASFNAAASTKLDVFDGDWMSKPNAHTQHSQFKELDTGLGLLSTRLTVQTRTHARVAASDVTTGAQPCADPLGAFKPLARSCQPSSATRP
jgi:hypothetical protein